MNYKPINEFFEAKQEGSSLPLGQAKSEGLLPGLNLISNEIVFIMNIKSGEMIFKNGFEHLGFPDSFMNLEKYTQLFHPEDAPYVHRLSQQSILWLADHPEASPDFLLYISFRVMKSDGTYVKVLCRVSCYDTFDNGVMRHALVHLSDISFTDTSEAVTYRFRALGLDRKEFHRLVYKDYLDLFTPRELQIIELIEKNRSNEEISGILGISKHTVSTHRKRILKRCGVHSAEELVLFCRKNGLL